MLYSDSEGKIGENPPQISILDHGFLFGDSVYEVLRTYDGRIFGWNEHLTRMKESARRISLSIDSLIPEIEKRAHSLLKAYGHPNAAIRIFVTRGVGKLHIDPRSCAKPTLLMAAWDYDQKIHMQPLRLAIASIRRLSVDSLDPAIKSGNYLNSVMAYDEAVKLHYDDAILLNSQGEITELTTSNIGWIDVNGVPVTPALSCGILYGVTRNYCLQANPNMKERVSFENDLKEACEVFALSTFKEIVQVKEVRFSDGAVVQYPAFEESQKLHQKLRGKIEEVLKSCPKVC